MRRACYSKKVKNKGLIFIAEDNEADANLLRIALVENQVEFELAVFSDGASALAAVEQAGKAASLPALFVLDLNLPAVDGLAILARIREQDVFNHTPVIVWSSSDSPRDKLLSEKAGANCYVSKPNDLATFLRLGELAKSLMVEKQTGHTVAA
jgi:two-component system, chemotaxis family, response regulator Rcp1